MKFFYSLFFAISLFFSSTSVLFCQVSVNVSNLDLVYRDIDLLVAHGLVKKIIVGQKPYSRQEVARIVAQAEHYFEKLKADFSPARVEKISHILSRLGKDYREELSLLNPDSAQGLSYSLHPLEKAEFDFTAADSPFRPIGNSNGIGFIEAEINPLFQNRQGRPLKDGTNLSLETSHWLRLSNYFAAYFQPRLQLTWHDGQDAQDFFVNQLYGKIYFKNVELEIGRDYLFWGQGKNAGLLLSNNPRGLDFIKLSNDAPFYFPGVFRYLGVHKISFFYSDLGPEQFFPHPYFIGLKWSVEPLSFFELGASLITLSGGEGSPPASTGDRIKDFFSGSSRLEISNKIAGFDFRFRIPPARGLELYGEFMIDDPHNILKRANLTFWEDSGWIIGVDAPRLNDSGTLSLRLEYHHTGKRYYRHGQFFSGNTLNHFLLGDALGPDAQGFYADLDWDIDFQNRLVFAGAYEDRSQDHYHGEFEGDDISAFVKNRDLPDERRYRALLSWWHRPEDLPLQLIVQVGYERTQNFAFSQNDDRNNFLGQVNLQWFLDSKTRWAR